MRKKIHGKHIVMLLFALLFYWGAKDGLTEAATEEGKRVYQTVPTPTPTSEPKPPAKTPGPPPPANESPGPTLTASEPPSRETSTAIALVETPVGGYVPTAEICGVPPTGQALDLVNVRSGPSTDFETIYQLVFLEVRPIVGRAEHSNWWLITLPDGTLGWVVDEAISVSGNIYVVPTIVEPSIEDGTALPTATWYPTPRPQCQPLPTFTPLPTEIEASPDRPATTEADREATPEKWSRDDPTVEASETPAPSPSEAESTISLSTETDTSATIGS